jgi:hypothetical protein
MSEKIVRISENANREKFIEMSKLVQEGKAKFIYYAIDGKIGYFHYSVNK